MCLYNNGNTPTGLNWFQTQLANKIVWKQFLCKHLYSGPVVLESERGETMTNPGWKFWVFRCLNSGLKNKIFLQIKNIKTN